MRSIRSRFIIGLIRNRHLFKFQLKRDVIDDTFSVNAFRNSIDKASDTANKRLNDVLISKADIGSLYGEWIDLPGTPDNQLIMYIHGGGFISGSCHTHRAHVAKIVRIAKKRALLFNYRLAPEHPYPAAPDDCLKVYRWLLDQGFKPKNITIMGESAGGTLTLSTLQKIKMSNLPQPVCAVSISPVTDLRSQSESFSKNASKDIAPYNSWHVWQGYYMGNTDPKDPVLSPLFGDLRNLAPLYLCIGTHEIHYDDTINYHNSVLAHKGISELHEYEGMVHAFPLMAPMFPEATMALRDICQFVNRWLANKD